MNERGGKMTETKRAEAEAIAEEIAAKIDEYYAEQRKKGMIAICQNVE